MGMHDNNLLLCADDDIGGIGTTTTGVTSTSSILLSPTATTGLRDIGQGTGLCVDVSVTEQFASGTDAARLIIYAVLSPTLPPTFGSPVGSQVYVGCHGPHSPLSLNKVTTAGLESATTFQIAISPVVPEQLLLGVAGYPYLNLVYAVTGEAFTAGKITARLGVAGRSPTTPQYAASTGGI